MYMIILQVALSYEIKSVIMHVPLTGTHVVLSSIQAKPSSHFGWQHFLSSCLFIKVFASPPVIEHNILASTRPMHIC